MIETTQITEITNLGLAIQKMPAIILHVDNKGQCHFANKEILQRMGGKFSDGSRLPYLAANLGREVIQGCIGNQPLSSVIKLKEFDLQASLPDQEVVHIKIRILPLADENSQDPGYLLCCYDHSDQKRIEQELAQKAKTLELLLSCAHIANSSFKFENAVISILDKICSYEDWLYSGWLISHTYLVDEKNPNRLLPSEIWSIQARESLDPFIDLTMKTELMIGEGVPGEVLATGQPIWSGRSGKNSPYPRARIADECGLLSVVAIPVSAGQKVIAVLEFFAAEERRPDDQLLDILMTIGEQLGMVYEREAVRAEQESERKAATAQIIQSSKLATLGEMATSVAHELNQPLNVIRMASGNVRRKLSKGTADPEYLNDKLERIEEQTARAAAIIDHMRMFGREANENPEPIDARNVVTNALDLVGEQ
ncbi:MAG: nitrogen-specific signal transduction histidine kinase, partial [Gammaproteobacteria bacterium]